jgi:DNA primase
MSQQHIDIQHVNDLLREAAMPRRHRGRRPIDFCALRGLVTMAEVLSLLGFRAASRQGDQVRGKCPVHASEHEKSRVFSANLRRNVYQCFSRRCGSKGNQFDLWIAATGLPAYEAAVSLCERLGKDVPYLPPRFEKKG